MLLTVLLTLIFALCPGVPRLLVRARVGQGSAGEQLARFAGVDWEGVPREVSWEICFCFQQRAETGGFACQKNWLFCVGFWVSAESPPLLDTYTNNSHLTQLATNPYAVRV